MGKIWNAQAVTGAATYYSDGSSGTGRGHKMENHSILGLTIVVTGTPTAQPVIQFSEMTDAECDDGQDDWDDYTEVTLPAVSGAATRFHVELVDFAPARWRLKWTNTSGTGTVTLRAHAKRC